MAWVRDGVGMDAEGSQSGAGPLKIETIWMSAEGIEMGHSRQD